MLTDNPSLLNQKIDRLIERAREEHMSNLVFEKKQTINLMRIFFKRQIKLLQTHPEFISKTAHQLNHIATMDSSFESVYQTLEKIEELQKEKQVLMNELEL
tara:strand:- start:2326 stop:2628 length:303 start_codon:yes stop_codon:yes gene_type:complete